ncbi:MAG: Uma2 family endonuclease [Myxacorys chilensis ATA2-1-KO14]|jgi:Uma2 family endonuclease|nr:Uma2 family endonuclease [Myxacorys chilensis ATA2-1-KO14]
MIMQAQEKRSYTAEEYLEFEVNSEERHAYIDGEITLMAGGLPNHNKIALNLSSSLNVGLKRQPFEVYMTDQRLWIPEKRIYTYPDVMLMAQPIQYQEGRRDTLINPLLIVEVLSQSTRSYDKDEKFTAYRTIPSFREYLLVDQDRMHVEHYIKTADREWMFREYEAETKPIEIASVPCQIELADLYDKVDFSSSEDAQTQE